MPQPGADGDVRWPRHDRRRFARSRSGHRDGLRRAQRGTLAAETSGGRAPRTGEIGAPRQRKRKGEPTDASHARESAADAVVRCSGFVTFVGRPNVGKSTLTNALVGEKIAITSEKPQTTRRAIRGILNRPTGQLVIVDTPGIHKPRTLLGERLNHLVEQVLGDVDVIGVLRAGDREGRARATGASRSRSTGIRRAKKVAIVTKTDAASREQITERLLEVDALREDWAAVIPLSALTGEQLEVLADEAAGAHARRSRRCTPRVS